MGKESNEQGESDTLLYHFCIPMFVFTADQYREFITDHIGLAGISKPQVQVQTNQKRLDVFVGGSHIANTPKTRKLEAIAQYLPPLHATMQLFHERLRAIALLQTFITDIQAIAGEHDLFAEALCEGLLPEMQVPEKMEILEARLQETRLRIAYRVLQADDLSAARLLQRLHDFVGLV
jgi:hypothetical protein